MPEVVLATTAAPTEGFTPSGAPGRVFSIVGTGAIWSDADDATYAHMDAGTPASGTNTIAAEAPLEPLALPSGATVTGIGVRFRYKATAWNNGTYLFTVRIKNVASNPPGVGQLDIQAGSSFGNIAVPADTAIHDIDYTLVAADFTDNARTLPEVIGWLEDGGWIWFQESSRPTTNTTSALWVYEAEVYVTYEGGTRPRLRKHPIASTRKWPPENWAGSSLRKVGSYQ